MEHLDPSKEIFEYKGDQVQITEYLDDNKVNVKSIHSGTPYNDVSWDNLQSSEPEDLSWA
jgi:hypothetical protein